MIFILVLCFQICIEYASFNQPKLILCTLIHLLLQNVRDLAIRVNRDSVYIFLFETVPKKLSQLKELVRRSNSWSLTQHKFD